MNSRTAQAYHPDWLQINRQAWMGEAVPGIAPHTWEDVSPPDRTHQRRIFQIEQAVEDSRSILALQDDWDDEGSVGYRVDTWERATTFLRSLTRLAYDLFGLPLSVPMISPADH